MFMNSESTWARLTQSRLHFVQLGFYVAYTVAQKTAPMFAYLSKICLLYFNGLTNFYQSSYILNFIIIAFK